MDDEFERELDERERDEREPPPPTPGGSADGTAYLQLIIDELTQERARKTSIEQRGVGVITTSGALVTLLFGLAALATKAQAYVLPDLARWTLVVALVLFAFAAVGGLVSNWILDYYEVGPGKMKAQAGSARPTDSTPCAGNAANERIKIIKSARRNNQFKAEVLRAAMIFEVAALAALAFAVGVVLVHQ